jgi:hypothetical protein
VVRGNPGQHRLHLTEATQYSPLLHQQVAVEVGLGRALVGDLEALAVAAHLTPQEAQARLAKDLLVAQALQVL